MSKLKPIPRRERGQVLLWVAILLPLFLALTGLVFDGGIMWQQYMRARWAASAGCVAAASEIDPQVFADTGRMVLKLPEAPQTAFNYAAWNDPDLYLTSVYVREENATQQIVAEGYTQIEPVFLRMFGVTGLRATVRAVERPAWGVVGADE